MTTGAELGEIAETVGAGSEVAGLESGYRAASSAAAALKSKPQSPEEAAGIGLGLVAAGAAAGAAFPPFGAAAGAIAGLAVAAGIALSQLLDAPPRYTKALTLDRFGYRRREARLRNGKLELTWKLGINGYESRFLGVPAGRTNLGTLLWGLRRVREDGGGAADAAAVLQGAGLPFELPPYPTAAEVATLGADVQHLWASLPFVPQSERQMSQQMRTFAGAYAAGLSVPAAREFAGLPPDPAASLYLADAKKRVAAALPPAPALGTKVSASALARLPVLTQALAKKPLILRISPRFDANRVRALIMGEDESWLLLGLAAAGVGVGWYVFKR